MRKTEPVPLEEAPGLSASTEELIEEAVGNQVALQVRRALTRTGPQHRCEACDRLTDSDSDTCRPCQSAGSEASVLHQVGRRMGFKNGVPLNLLEILGLPDEELLQMTADDLACLFDRNATLKMPSQLEAQNFVSGNLVMDKLVPVEWREVQIAQRPPTAREEAKRIQDEATAARLLREAAQTLSQERRIEKAKTELAAALTIQIAGQ